MAAVNRPTDTKLKEQDVNQKLQFYGISTALSKGKVPSNKQVDVALNSLLESRPFAQPSSKLSEEGRKLVADLEQVIKEAKYLLLTKNEGNLLQDFIWSTQHVTAGDAKLPGAPTDKQTAQQHGQQALDGMKTLGTLLISNGQFRKLLKDATIIMRDMAGDAATNAAGRVNPRDEDMAQLDNAAEDNTWHDAPDFSKERMRSQMKASYDKQKPFNRSEMQQAQENAANSADQQTDPDGKPTEQSGKAGAQAGAQALRDQASANVPEETKQRGREFQQSSKNYLGSKMPKERREQTIWRLKKMLTEIQGHADYQKAIETLLDLAETYTRHGRNMSQQGAGTVKGARTDNSLREVEANLKTLIERFANCTSSEDLFDSIKNIYADAERDPELKDWFKSIDTFLRKCLKEQGYILQPKANEEFDQLYNKGNYLLRERYRDHTNRVIDETKFLADQFDQDPRNKSFAQAMQKLFESLGKDESGKPAFKKHLIQDISNVIVPAIFEHTRYVPIPRIEVKDTMIDVVVENLIVESDNLAPNILEFTTDNHFRWGRKKISNKHDNKIMIACSGVQMDLRDVSYYIKKKEGFPSITDKGVMDIFLGGEGFSFKIAASNAHKKDRQHFVKVDKVDVDVKNLKINLKESNYKLLFKIAQPLLLKVMRPAIQKVLEKQIRDSFAKADSYLYDIHREAEKAMEQSKSNADPEAKANIYKEYATALQKKMTAKKDAKKQEAEKKSSGTEVKMAVTNHDSLFPDIKLPGGISSKATEFKDLGMKGDKWESPVFGIGSAKETSDMPKLPAVSRKPHNAASSGVRGPSGQSAGMTGGTGTGSNGYQSTTNGNPSGGFMNQVEQAFGMNKDQSRGQTNASGAAMTSS